MNVMVVDDEHHILKGLLTMIGEASQYVTEVVGAMDGEEALDKLRFFQADVLITDINMPEMNGLELIRQVKAEGLCSRFVVLTGYGQFEYARTAIKYQVMDYLLKPINYEELISVLGTVFSEVKQAEQQKDKEFWKAVQDTDEPLQVSESMHNIMAYIHLNYDKDISLLDISNHVNMHPNYVGSLFKKELGITFLSYLHKHRINLAKRKILLDTEKPLYEIARLVGFEHIRHFFKVFRKYTGLSPGEFRSKYKR